MLIFVVIKNRRSILASEIEALPIRRSRVVHLPECLQQLLVRDHRWIVGNLHHFRVSGPQKHPAAKVAIFVRAISVLDEMRRAPMMDALPAIYILTEFTTWISVNPSRPHGPFSTPIPDHFAPPNGRLGAIARC